MILLIEDEPALSQMLKVAIEGTTNFHIEVASNLNHATDLLSHTQYAAVITDLNLPDSFGERTLKEVLKAAPHIPVIVITGGDSECSYERAIFLGAQDFVEKTGMSVSELVRVIRKAIARHKVRRLFEPIEHEIEEAEKLIKKFKAGYK